MLGPSPRSQSEGLCAKGAQVPVDSPFDEIMQELWVIVRYVWRSHV